MDKENFIAGNAADCIGIYLAHQSVKAVQNKPDIVMVSAPNDLPSVPVIVDITAPGQCLIPNAKPPLFRAVSELVKICRGAIYAANRLWVTGGANQHEIRSQFLDQVELVLGSIEGLCAQMTWQPLKITKGLKNGDFKSH